MATDIRVDPRELTRLAGIVLAASRDLADGWRTAKHRLDLPPNAFGAGRPAAAAMHRAHASVVDAADTTIGRQVSILEDDVDRLYRVAFAYEQADLDARQTMDRASGGRP
jgi:hypothetical protein